MSVLLTLARIFANTWQCHISLIISFERYAPDVQGNVGLLMSPPSSAGAPSSAGYRDQVSVTGRSIIPAGSVSPTYQQLLSDIRTDRFGRQSFRNPYQSIDIARIKRGADVRTTVSHFRAVKNTNTDDP